MIGECPKCGDIGPVGAGCVDCGTDLYRTCPDETRHQTLNDDTTITAEDLERSSWFTPRPRAPKKDEQPG